METEAADLLDRQDMARLAAGHDAALNDLMARHAPRLFHYLIRQLRDESEAEDLAQEAFVRVFQNRQKFNPQYRFVTWLYTIATNLARTQQRRQSRHPQVSLEAESEFTDGSLKDRLPAETADAAEHLETAERQVVVRDAIAGLPEELREPLLLAEYEELSQREIAEILQCTPKAVEMRLYHARQQLRRSLVNYF
jgi:RNA polymerase sigma-70 factor (ECF subfamily)